MYLSKYSKNDNVFFRFSPKSDAGSITLTEKDHGITKNISEETYRRLMSFMSKALKEAPTEPEEKKKKDKKATIGDYIRLAVMTAQEERGKYIHVMSDGDNAVAIITPSQSLTKQKIPAQIKNEDLKDAQRAPMAVVKQLKRALKTEMPKFIKATEHDGMQTFVATKLNTIPLLKPRQMDMKVEGMPLKGEIRRQIEKIPGKAPEEGEK